SFTFSTSTESYFLKKSDFRSRLAIFMASTPRLAPRVPAPISDLTSIIFISFTGSTLRFKNELIYANVWGIKTESEAAASEIGQAVCPDCYRDKNKVGIPIEHVFLALQRWQIYPNIAPYF